MANSRVGQYRLEFDLTGFSSPARSHVVGLWVMPLSAPTVGESPSDITIQLRGGGYKNLQLVANQFGDFLRRLYAVTVNVSNFTLWKYVTEHQRSFQSAGQAVLTVAGQFTVTPAGQTTLTFRHTNGGIGKVVFLESNLVGSEQYEATPDPVGTDIQRMINYLMSVDSPMLALDNSYPLTPLKESRGENEKIWRKIYRP